MTKATQTAGSPTADKIQEMVRRIVDLFQPEKVILFGSHARGTAGPDSDVDLMVVMDTREPKREVGLRIRVALHGMGIAKDIVVVTPAEIERYRDLVGSLICPALREGRVLYERLS
jgi:predicted nucleotidyltransferase